MSALNMPPLIVVPHLREQVFCRDAKRIVTSLLRTSWPTRNFHYSRLLLWLHQYFINLVQCLSSIQHIKQTPPGGCVQLNVRLNNHFLENNTRTHNPQSKGESKWLICYMPSKWNLPDFTTTSEDWNKKESLKKGLFLYSGSRHSYSLSRDRPAYVLWTTAWQAGPIFAPTELRLVYSKLNTVLTATATQ